MNSTSPCFVCDGPSRGAPGAPGAWREPRAMCQRHRDALRLPTGERLADFLARRAPADDPLEGSGLNYVINPASVDGQRVWLDFHFAGAAAYEQWFHAESWFEYLVLHRPAFVDLLQALARQRLKAPQEDPGYSLIIGCQPHARAINTLFELHRRQMQVDALAQQRGGGFVASPEEAERAVLASGEIKLQSSVALLAAELVRLAARRFTDGV